MNNCCTSLAQKITYSEVSINIKQALKSNKGVWLTTNIFPYLSREASGLFSNQFMEVEEAIYKSTKTQIEQYLYSAAWIWYIGTNDMVWLKSPWEKQLFFFLINCFIYVKKEPYGCKNGSVLKWN